MKKLFIFLIVSSLFINGIYTQNIANYSFSTNQLAVLENMTGGTVQLIGPSSQDVSSVITDIGFEFKFMGMTYSQFSVNSNGQFRLGGTLISNTGISDAAPVMSLLVPISGGNSILSTGKVHYKVSGTLPNRILIVEWKDLNIPYPILDNNPPIIEYNPTQVQVFLHETTGLIEFKYGSVFNNSVPTVTRSTFISSGNTATTVKYIGSDLISAINASPVATYPLNAVNTANLNQRYYSFSPILPPPPTVTVTNNCDGTSTLTASNYTGSLLWSTSETTATLTVTVGGNYSVTQTVNGFTSLPATVFAAPGEPAGVSIASDQNNVCTGTAVTLTATPTNGGAAPSYQWYNKLVPVGTNSATYSYTPANGDLIKVVMTSNATPCLSGSPVTSNVVTMTVNPTLSAGVSIASDQNNVCAGTAVTLTATPTNGGAAPSYQWYKNTLVVGTGDSYTYNPVNGDVVYVVMTSSELCSNGSLVTSNAITMNVNPIIYPTVTLNVTSNVVTAGMPATFEAHAQGGGTTPVYRWFVNNTLNANTGNVFTYIPADNDEVYVEMTSNASPCLSGSPVVSNTIKMSVSIGTSINQSVDSKFNVYSFNKNIFVDCKEEAEQIFIYNSLGSLLKYETNVNGLKKFDMNNVVSAYYIVKVITQYNVYSERVLLK